MLFLSRCYIISLLNTLIDHFLETDLYDHSWEVLHDIIGDDEAQDILLDIGMPVCGLVHGICHASGLRTIGPTSVMLL